MSRSNPGKLKPERPRTTLFAFGEGETEEAFLKYLKGIYAPRGCGTFVKVEGNSGGDPSSIVEEAVKGMLWGNFNKGLVLLDKDQSWPIELESIATKNNLILIGSKPCVEGLFLSILIPTFNQETFSSDICKKKFNKEYLTDKQALECCNYKSIFPQELLEDRKSKILELGAIITRITEDNL